MPRPPSSSRSSSHGSKSIDRYRISNSNSLARSFSSAPRCSKVLGSHSTQTPSKQSVSSADSGRPNDNRVPVYVPKTRPLPTISLTPSFFSPSYNLARIISCDYDSVTGSNTYLLERRQPPISAEQQHLTFVRVAPEEVLEHVSQAELEIFDTKDAERREQEERQAAEILKRKVFDRRARGRPSESVSSASEDATTIPRKLRGRPPKSQIARVGRPPKARAGASGYPMVLIPVRDMGNHQDELQADGFLHEQNSAPIDQDQLDTEMQEPEWEVSKILDDQLAWDGSGKRLYLVEWVGYEDEQTWEPLENLEGAEEAFEEYWSSKKKKKKKPKLVEHTAEISASGYPSVKQVRRSGSTTILDTRPGYGSGESEASF